MRFIINLFSVSENVEKKDVFIAVVPSDDESARRRAELLRKYVMPHKNLIYSICIKYTYNQEDIEDNYLEALVRMSSKETVFITSYSTLS